MRIFKKLIWRVYLIFLQLRWGISSPAASLLGKACMSDYRSKKLSFFGIWAIHRMGFTVSDWTFMSVTKNNYKDFLSSVDYFRMHPVNGTYSKWIDDKLTLKYLCAGTALDRYMPDYYYQIDGTGRILCLMDAPERKDNALPEDVAQLLRAKGVLALKLIAGSIGEGFYKAEYRDGVYFLNGKEISLDAFCGTIGMLRNYLVIEFLSPHEEIAAYCPETVNCIRYQAGSVDGRLKMLKGFIRFGTKRSGFVENYNAGGVLCYLDESGCFVQGNVISEDRLSNLVVYEHPDSGKVLCGKIPMWDQITEAVEAFGAYFPQLQYMGMDFVVTSDHQVKILEINSLTSLDSLQIDMPVWKTDAAEFFRKRVNK